MRPAPRETAPTGTGGALIIQRGAEGSGSPSRTRTCDKAINSRLLYQLSYRGSRRDLYPSRAGRARDFPGRTGFSRAGSFQPRRARFCGRNPVAEPGRVLLMTPRPRVVRPTPGRRRTGSQSRAARSPAMSRPGWPRGGVVTQRTANPCTPVRFRARPPPFLLIRPRHRSTRRRLHACAAPHGSLPFGRRSTTTASPGGSTVAAWPSLKLPRDVHARLRASAPPHGRLPAPDVRRDRHRAPRRVRRRPARAVHAGGPGGLRLYRPAPGGRDRGRRDPLHAGPDGAGAADPGARPQARPPRPRRRVGARLRRRDPAPPRCRGRRPRIAPGLAAASRERLSQAGLGEGVTVEAGPLDTGAAGHAPTMRS